MTTFRAEQFDVRVSDEVLADLRARILNTRWPGAAPGAAWGQGTDLGYLQDLLGYWADGFDWRAQERWLKAFTPSGCARCTSAPAAVSVSAAQYQP